MPCSIACAVGWQGEEKAHRCQLLSAAPPSPRCRRLDEALLLAFPHQNKPAAVPSGMHCAAFTLSDIKFTSTKPQGLGLDDCRNKAMLHWLDDEGAR